MGALLPMRDAPNDAPVPVRFEPDTSYYDKTIEQATARISELESMTLEQRAEEADKANAARQNSIDQAVDRNSQLDRRYSEMRVKVEAWEGAPAGLKELMLEQLGTSQQFDVSEDPVRFYDAPVDATQWFARELLRASKELQNALTRRQEEVDRTEKRNEWLAQLHKSLEGIE